MRCATFVRAIIIILLTTVAARGQTEYRYAFLMLPPLGGEHSFGWGMNEFGDVVGSAFLPGNNAFHATLWIDGEPIDLGTLGHVNSRAQDANASGWVVGFSGCLGSERAFLWRDGLMEDIGTLGGNTANAFAINDADDVVGSSRIHQTFTSAFLWRDGQMEDLGSHAGRGSWAYDVNSAGQVVGRSYSAESSWRAALWENGKIIDLGTLRPDNTGTSEAYGINDLGQIVGFAQGYLYRYYAAVWHNGQIYDLGVPQGTRESYAKGINNLGQIVGHGYLNHRSIGFLWEPQRGMQRLDDLLPARTTFYPRLVWAINDAGQITGIASPKSAPESQDLAFIMSPVNLTMDLAAPSPGRAGESNMITVTNCTPGERVTFLYSRNGGGQRIPGCDLQQNALQLDSPTVIGTAVADGNGVATITRTVPPIARNQTILFQAVVQNECAISQLVVHRFE